MPHQRRAVARWWRQLDHHDRADVLELEPSDFIPERLAVELQLHGIHIPDLSVAWDLKGVQRTIRVYVQPEVLKDFLASVRIWLAAWSAPSTTIPDGTSDTTPGGTSQSREEASA